MLHMDMQGGLKENSATISGRAIQSARQTQWIKVSMRHFTSMKYFRSNACWLARRWNPQRRAFRNNLCVWVSKAERQLIHSKNNEEAIKRPDLSVNHLSDWAATFCGQFWSLPNSPTTLNDERLNFRNFRKNLSLLTSYTETDQCDVISG